VNDHLDTDRIDHLLRRELTRQTIVTVVGLGSGGAPVTRLLAQCGVRRWHLFDPDTLQAVNLVKHPARRSDLGRLKVDIEAEWLKDRHPDAEVATYAEDVRDSRAFEVAVGHSDLVICAVDCRASRELINASCVRAQVPMVAGMVFRKGFGGSVYAYAPGQTGCYACMEAFAEASGLALDPGDALSDEEESRIYGLGELDFAHSGLAIDITTIAALHAHLAIAALYGREGTPIPPPEFNWLIFGNRPHPAGGFPTRFASRRLDLRPRRRHGPHPLPRPRRGRAHPGPDPPRRAPHPPGRPRPDPAGDPPRPLTGRGVGAPRGHPPGRRGPRRRFPRRPRPLGRGPGLDSTQGRRPP